MNARDHELMMNLLADRATQGLSVEEELELKRLMDIYPKWSEFDGAEWAAAAVNLSNVETDEPLPQTLRAKVEADATRYFESSQPQTSLLAEYTAAQSHKDVTGAIRSETKNGSSVVMFPATRRWQWAGWYAAAACLLLAIFAWLPRSELPTAPQVSSTRPLTLAEQRARLLAEAPDLVRATWTPTGELKNAPVRGDIVWSSTMQKGYMSFEGLPINNPDESTYQLWMFDRQQDERYPVDGGIFDVKGIAGEIIVPIEAKIAVREPTL
ncbi:MAG: anti-sigma factor, partial [Pyrinomonadaceae bacterium]|nr:anti-sigma factor [Pyrinomonadaceae bacterium]